MPGPFQITPAQLSRLIGLPDAPMIIDVRIDEDFATDSFLIPASQRIAHGDIDRLAPTLGVQRAVVVCQRGKKLSEGAAAILRLHGIAAEVLEGGFVGWRAAGLPAIPAKMIPTSGLWVTRQRPKIDRIACPWLIRRFIDPMARFLFVAASEVANVAEKFDATPFDIEGVHFTHRGENCSFDALIDDFNLHDPALDRLALVIRAADTDRHDLAPQATGLLAISVGLSRQYRDDLAQLEAGMAVYDALYRWARDGFDEGHDWPASRGQA
ncbi:chromate resistance protein ChrB domain-containing protein [Neogemmobacter tilapiae]|uniref:Sulfurtransferase n=1 Tax=Neogemmobacter tilapiae TaxID=875041 RepID=A0A918U076_9RHOB|nr:sulfurtransferase/chromate resistance protein [Gemmobacter tilapiae]GHC67139.1 sulfurtransferase [Gemmobacter tilapiae]